MQELSRQQVWSMPLEEIQVINNQWRHIIQEHDLQRPRYMDINKYIIKTYDEIAYQFLWETFSPGRREQERTGFNTNLETTFKDLFNEED